MGDLHKKLIERFGQEAIQIVTSPFSSHNYFLIVDKKNSVSIICSDRLSHYEMSVPEKLNGRERNELYFALPSYWEIHNSENERFNWVFYWLDKLIDYVIEKKSWFGPGHTIPCGTPFKAISSTMKANHFLLSDPILFEEELIPIETELGIVHFLAVIPIFEDEMDYKQGKGTFKLMTKLKNQGITEKLDDFRSTSLKSKWRLRMW